MIVKSLEFMITSKIIKDKYKTNAPVIFDKMGKIAVNMVMLMPGLFVFRCFVTNYLQVMNITVYIITISFIISFFSRIIYVIKLGSVPTTQA
jgi:phosphatidylglycerophosphate synthase